MKTFETPVVDVKKFDVMDVLTASVVDTEEEDVPPPPMGAVGSNCV